MTHTVYLHLDAEGTVIYAGCTGHIKNRTRDHARKSPWWPSVAEVAVDSEHTSYYRARAREAELIRSLKPAHNVKGGSVEKWRSLALHEGMSDEEELAYRAAASEAASVLAVSA